MRHLVVYIFVVLLLPFSAAAQTATPDSVAVPVDYTDGPYVFWQNDTTAIVFYICNDTLAKYAINVRDTLRFDGFCFDSALSYTIVTGSNTVEPFVYDDVRKIFAVSDIHGEYEYFVDLLMKAGIIDHNHNWIWGDGHLVVLGDVFDRGDKVTECLWLIYKLEQQARETFGRVHYLLGNHELMVLQADNRYIHERYLDGIARKSRIDHDDLYGPDMELGRWLRTKHTAVRLNDILFVHGGISVQFVERGWLLSSINEEVRRKLDLRSSRIAFDDSAKLLFGSGGPLWYRGYHYAMEGKYEQAKLTAVDSVLSAYGAVTMVVGHSEDSTVRWIYGHRVLAIDIPVEEVGSLQGVVWEGGDFRVVEGAGELWLIE